MRDIFKPEQKKPTVLTIRKEPDRPVVSSTKEKKEQAESLEIKSSFIIAQKKKSPIKKFVLFFLIILIVCLASLFAYYIFVVNKSVPAKDSTKSQPVDDIDKFQDNLNDIDTSNNNVSNDTKDTDTPTVDFNVSL